MVDVAALFIFIFPIFCKASEEVIIQQIADFEEHIGIDPRTVKDLVDILPRIAQLFSEPGDGATLLLKHLFDNMSNMGFFHAFVRLTEPSP